jgi:hypothetical protein
MPLNQIKSLAQKSGKSEGEVEKLYKEAKKVVEKEYDLTEKDGDKFFALVYGVLKKMVGVSDSLMFSVCKGCGSAVLDSDEKCSGCGSLFDADQVKLILTKKDVNSISSFLNIMLNNRVVFKDLLRHISKTVRSYGSNNDSINLGNIK